MDKKKTEKKSVITYDKESLVNSKRYRDKRDILTALLEVNKRYTLEQVNSLINSFLKKGVK